MFINFLKRKTMKKLSILLLAVFYVGIANLSAQTEATNPTTTTVEEVKETKICPKTGKTCEKTCKNKKDGTGIIDEDCIWFLKITKI